jgi:phospholipid-binding lipoprotein MlaA
MYRLGDCDMPTGAPWLVRLTRFCLKASLVMLPMAAMAADEDPWESFNRPIFTFNDTLDTYALKPIAQGYQKVTPQFAQDGVSNFFGNLGEPRNLLNNLLQANFHGAGVDTSRFIFNSTFGVLGLIDVASRMGLQKSDEDFGQTLGKWGVSSGPYVVLPFFGPSTVRDTVGRVPDTYVSVYPYVDDVPVRNTIRGLGVVDVRASLLQAERMITGDKYTFVRNVYLQNREFRIKDGEVEDDF